MDKQNAQHTPGPWKAISRNRRLRDGREVYDVVGDASRNPEYWEVVAVKVIGADVHLITAAPDLLAACEHFIAAYEQVGGFSDPEVTTAMLKARAAIAKAEGRETDEADHA